MAAQQPLSGTIVVIIIAVGVQVCLITFILAKRQIQRLTLRNRRGPHASVGHGAPKHLRREADRLIEYVSHIKVDPPLQQQSDGDYRRQTLLEFQSLEQELANYSQNYIRPPGANVRSFLVGCQHGPLTGVDSKLVHQVCDDHDAARHHYEEVTRVKYRTFLERLDVLKAAVRANKLVKPVPSPLPPPRSDSPRKRVNRRAAPLLMSSVVSVDNNRARSEDRADV